MCAAWNTCMICWIRCFSWSVTRWSLTYWLWHHKHHQKRAIYYVQRRVLLPWGLSVLWISSQITCSSFVHIVFTNQSIKRILGLFLSTMHNFSLMTYTWFWGYFILINVVEINGANVNVESTIKPIEVHIINQLLINHTKTALQQSYTLKG